MAVDVADVIAAAVTIRHWLNNRDTRSRVDQNNHAETDSLFQWLLQPFLSMNRDCFVMEWNSSFLFFLKLPMGNVTARAPHTLFAETVTVLPSSLLYGVVVLLDFVESYSRNKLSWK